MPFASVYSEVFLLRKLSYKFTLNEKGVGQSKIPAGVIYKYTKH